MPKFKTGQLVVLLTAITNCGCSTAEAGTIAKLNTDTPDKDGELEAVLCPDGCINYIKSENIRPLQVGKETTTAKKKFEFATNWRYATID